MNTINFEQAGGFPLTQDTLNFMQKANVEAFGALAVAFSTLCSCQYVILSGCEDKGFNNVSSGVVSINGEIMPFQEGEKNVGVAIVKEKTAVVYKDGSQKDAYHNKYAKFVSGGGEIPWSAFKRVPSSMPASDVYAWAKAVSKPNYTAAEVGAAGANHTHTKAQITDFPTSLPASDVPAWAKAASKPNYTAAEVGAAGASHTHTKVNITDFPTSLPASDVPTWAKAASKPTYNASEVGALPSSGTITVNGETKNLKDNPSFTVSGSGSNGVGEWIDGIIDAEHGLANNVFARFRKNGNDYDLIIEFNINQDFDYLSITNFPNEYYCASTVSYFDGSSTQCAVISFGRQNLPEGVGQIYIGDNGGYGLLIQLKCIIN